MCPVWMWYVAFLGYPFLQIQAKTNFSHLKTPNLDKHPFLLIKIHIVTVSMTGIPQRSYHLTVYKSVQVYFSSFWNAIHTYVHTHTHKTFRSYLKKKKISGVKCSLRNISCEATTHVHTTSRFPLDFLLRRAAAAQYFIILPAVTGEQRK